jgi:hypothetical protein
MPLVRVQRNSGQPRASPLSRPDAYRAFESRKCHVKVFFEGSTPAHSPASTYRRLYVCVTRALRAFCAPYFYPARGYCVALGFGRRKYTIFRVLLLILPAPLPYPRPTPRSIAIDKGKRAQPCPGPTPWRLRHWAHFRGRGRRGAHVGIATPKSLTHLARGV